MLFKEILCNNNIKRKLLSSYHNNMIPHSQFFFGKSGSPNLVLAIAYSQYLMCKKRIKLIHVVDANHVLSTKNLLTQIYTLFSH